LRFREDSRAWIGRVILNYSTPKCDKVSCIARMTHVTRNIRAFFHDSRQICDHVLVLSSRQKAVSGRLDQICFVRSPPFARIQWQQVRSNYDTGSHSDSHIFWNEFHRNNVFKEQLINLFIYYSYKSISDFNCNFNNLI